MELSQKELKAMKKAEKLAKLEQKKNAPPVAPSTKPKKVPVGGYNCTEVEKYWTDYWLKNESFIPEGNGKPFCMCIPPPNITGSLHIGHSMMIAIQDCIVRYKRLTGHEVLFLPGTDHAGIATQNVVMKNLGYKGVNRETFLEAAFNWSEKYGNRIYEQFNRLGTSLDYTRKVFTLDAKRNASVNKAFCTLFKKGLIYRDSKIVSWSGKLQTTLSDLEVDYKNIEGGAYLEVDGGKYKFGMLYYIKYYLTRTPEVPEDISTLPYLVIATTRPETILGDSGVCVNPNDERFADLNEIFKNGLLDPMNEKNSKKNEGQQDQTEILDNTENEEYKKERKNKYKTVKKVQEAQSTREFTLFAVNPITRESIPVILDEQADLAFGTGILKVTPAHDPVDFKLGKKHNLKFTEIFDSKNRVNHEKFNGLGRFEARKAIVAELKSKNLLVKEEEHPQIIPICNRSGDIIEPMVKEQWWCECKSMAKRALDAVHNNEIKLYPAEAKSIWNRWLENIKDWCLSRQLWWGHRIPAYRAVKGSETEWFVAETYEEALKQANEKGFESVTQDEDVLDTWFSSGLWPFSTLGWPEETVDLKKFFPNSILETGSDILFFWVARMVMLSFELTGERPFDKILLHGLVRDAHGRKMSKSLGNVIDPLDVIDGITLEELTANLQKGNLDQRELRRATDVLRQDFPNGIAKCGADALRFTLVSYTSGMNDVNLDILRVQGNARLCNKIYNAFLFVKGENNEITDMKKSDLNKTEVNISNLNISNTTNTICSDLMEHQKWILKRLNETIEQQHICIDSFNFIESTKSLYAFFYEFCDVFIEISKANFPGDKNILKRVFNSILCMFHPYMPFISTDLYFKLNGELLKNYPLIYEGNLENKFEDVLGLAKICRTETVKIENFEGSFYLKNLVKKEIEIVEKLEEIDSKIEKIGELKFMIEKKE